MSEEKFERMLTNTVFGVFYVAFFIFIIWAIYGLFVEPFLHHLP